MTATSSAETGNHVFASVRSKSRTGVSRDITSFLAVILTSDPSDLLDGPHCQDTDGRLDSKKKESHGEVCARDDVL